MSKLGELLVKANLVTQGQLEDALKVQSKEGGRLGYTLIKMGYASETDITAFLSKQYNVPAINLHALDITPEIISLIPPDIAKKYQVLPVNRSSASLTLAMADPTNVFAMDDIKFMTGYKIEPVVTSELALHEAIEKYY
jgi:type IV pilus assembly protein PilB